MFYADKKEILKARAEIRKIKLIKNVNIEENNKRNLTSILEEERFPKDNKKYKTGISAARISGAKGTNLIY